VEAQPGAWADRELATLFLYWTVEERSLHGAV